MRKRGFLRSPAHQTMTGGPPYAPLLWVLTECTHNRRNTPLAKTPGDPCTSLRWTVGRGPQPRAAMAGCSAAANLARRVNGGALTHHLSTAHIKSHEPQTAEDAWRSVAVIPWALPEEQDGMDDHRLVGVRGPKRMDCASAFPAGVQPSDGWHRQRFFVVGHPC